MKLLALALPDRKKRIAVAIAILLAAATSISGADRASVRVLLVTGQDYPGHVWKETAPALAAGLREDSRLRVDVVESPDFLARPGLTNYDAVVLHFMNWEQPSPGAAARRNLQEFVRNGGGLVLVHFACGAWQDWPEFRQLAGRVYDPQLPPHDPRGPFQVELVATNHPVLRGLKSFAADDELYTCLTGDRPIQVLATAHSRVTHKDEPMAFVLEYGKGRVFHSPLGHDVKALTMPGVAELFRRGTAWVSGLPPARD